MAVHSSLEQKEDLKHTRSLKRIDRVQKTNYHNVRIFVEKFNEFFETPKAAFKAPANGNGNEDEHENENRSNPNNKNLI